MPLAKYCAPSSHAWPRNRLFGVAMQAWPLNFRIYAEGLG